MLWLSDKQKGFGLMIYTGNNDYIFISYAHKDSQKVLPILDVLNERGFRIWYDAGIEAGTEWPAYIEEHLNNASVVLVFMTPNTIESRNCRNEINFALELNKEVLVIYLEDTPLLKGMRLQLNSTQSLFRSHHRSDETFIHELIGARILQRCREGSGETVIPQKKTEPERQNTTIITNVCSIGTNDEHDLWPNGTYSQTINRDEFRVVFFHMSLLKPFGFSGTINNKYQIYNSENNLIFEHEPAITIEPNYDKISAGWIIKGSDGSFVPSGEYRFVCSINNSASFTYFFSVCSNNDVKSNTSPKKSFLERAKLFFSD